jgi:ribosomal protein S6--L-glutamate ligase
MQVSREMSTQIMVLCIISKSKMNIAILSYSSPTYKSNRLIIQEGKKRNHNVFVISPDNLVLYLSDKEGTSRIYTNENKILERLPTIDAVIPRVATNVSHCASIIDFFINNLGVYSTQSGDSIRVCSSKWWTLMKANENDIKVPKTIYCSDFKSENLDSFVDSLGFPIILKLNSSSQGIGIIKILEKQTLKTIIETFNRQSKPFLLQEMINTKGKQHDFRTIVIGKNNCVVTMKKTVNGNKEFRTNLARQGVAQSYELTEKERQFCIRVAQTIDSDICGIDWIVKDGQPVLLENNSNMGTKVIDVVGHNFFEDLFFHIEVAVQDFKKSKKEKDDNQKQNNFLYEEIQNLKNELNKKENLLNEIFDNEKMKNLFRSLKGKFSGYTDSEKKEKKIKIIKPKQIIEMMLDMIEIEK